MASFFFFSALSAMHLEMSIGSLCFSHRGKSRPIEARCLEAAATDVYRFAAESRHPSSPFGGIHVGLDVFENHKAWKAYSAPVCIIHHPEQGKRETRRQGGRDVIKGSVGGGN